MKFSPAERKRTPVANPPPESAYRVDGGGPWGPTQFDLPGRDGTNTQAVVIVALVGVVILLVIAGLWLLMYRQFN